MRVELQLARTGMDLGMDLVLELGTPLSNPDSEARRDAHTNTNAAVLFCASAPGRRPARGRVSLSSLDGDGSAAVVTMTTPNPQLPRPTPSRQAASPPLFSKM